MATDQREWTERRMRTIAAEAGLPEPDRVEYREASIVLFWDEQKLAVEIDEIPDGPPPPFDPCDLDLPAEDGLPRRARRRDARRFDRARLEARQAATPSVVRRPRPAPAQPR